MFYNKKGLLAEIKKTEQKINEKILVLEDLLDSAKSQSLVPGIENKEFFELNQTQKIKNENTPALNRVKSKIMSMAEPIYALNKSESSEADTRTICRTLSLKDAQKIEFGSNEVSQIYAELDSELDHRDSDAHETEELAFDDLPPTSDFSEDEIMAGGRSDSNEDDKLVFDGESEDWGTDDKGDVDAIVGLATAASAEDQKTMVGVKSIIREAKENLEKIDVTDNIKIKSFKDVVLLAKKIDHLR